MSAPRSNSFSNGPVTARDFDLADLLHPEHCPCTWCLQGIRS